MSGEPGAPVRPMSGMRMVLQYTGIPPSWLDKRPRLPSRNWLIFLSVTSSIAGLYIYDRRECSRIRQEYVDRVKHLADAPLHSHDVPRKVTVYGARWPGDEDYDRSMRHFRKYVKPVLVAAAIDYDMIKGKRSGDIATLIANEIKARRRVDVGLEPPPQRAIPLPINFTPEEKRRREIDGGIVLVGPSTFKEFMSGLKSGWTDSLEKVDQEARLAHELALDGRFDEPEPEQPELDAFDDDHLTPGPSPLRNPAFSPFQQQLRSPTPKPPPTAVPEHLNAPPATIPPLPPLLLVPFIDYIGISQIPLMIAEAFNERQHVRSGAEAGYRLVMAHTRPFHAPETAATSSGSFLESASEPQAPADTTGTDLEFGRDAEKWYKSSLVKRPAEIEKARNEYYAALPAKLNTARALARREREPTKDEAKYPPPTEVELRAERMEKEKRWRSDLRGWEVVRPTASVAWDERFRDALRVFVDPGKEGESNRGL